ncbi:hypothetical protein EB796_005781 [Bugula neritina]|uniref:Uncharacterized protein n=1 Tax=Bugula neritina TaxID=10212 RepID=A0A7J7KB97_BUGNE|nr:hypothetical protein EB796_005781 [Bugula neritina]
MLEKVRKPVGFLPPPILRIERMFGTSRVLTVTCNHLLSQVWRDDVSRGGWMPYTYIQGLILDFKASFYYVTTSWCS